MPNKEMVKAIVIGDLHFNDKPRGLLESQKSAVLEIVSRHPECEQVIFLGDLMMHRNPRPQVLLALKEVIDSISKTKEVFILRGNHDSVNKSDDGVTALSLFESKKVKVITQTWVDDKNKRVLIPHYEDEEKIRTLLSKCPAGYTVFGHFGYFGSLNSAGDADFGLSISDFANPTILGHIHGFRQEKNITILGTPYSTNFSEFYKENFYGILEGSSLELFPITFGPRYLPIDYYSLEENLSLINDPAYFTLLRVMVSTIQEDHNNITDLIEKLDVGYVEVKYRPLLADEEVFSKDDYINPIVEINDSLIEDYINSSSTLIGKEKLLEGLSLIHENQQSRN
jgi:predicted phosphodiesterase